MNYRTFLHISVYSFNNGDLLLNFKTGQMKESAPIAWQDIDGKLVEVKTFFIILDDNEVGLEVEEIKPWYPLVIDPVLSWHTILEGSASDKGTQKPTKK